ncbi:DUF308 domain-containing protein [Bradyrhizobium tropiciagri]|uniref:DUF308 domain-containing protein n=1 Tax=Bradyrhizobium tropiciagri TaxID=312253 RepID=UPI001BA9A1B3|nr:DUF308 domain-containing protein [Bradyrhizobium tropiciagri]MBR0872309.1 DUF308 domain-containing protein [Bradyrhizobium tropiciagri]
MMVALLVVGAGLIVAGLAAIGFGIPNKEFSVGGMLIATGVDGVCAGAIVLALAVVVRELQTIGRRLGHAGAEAEFPLPPAAATSPQGAVPGDFDFPSPPPRERRAAVPPPLAQPPAPPAPAATPPWHEEIASRGGQDEEAATATAADAAAPPKRRNLLFSSNSRKERERGQGRAAEPLTPDLLSPELRPSPAAAAEPAPATFDDAWPKVDRPRSVDVAPRRAARTPSTFGEAQQQPAPPSPGHPPPPQEQPAVTVLKSGVVDGMAYSLYSDGSIEAQMPEGMMRFASIDELRSHLEQRP